jgi:hypothetical protein
VVAYTDAVKVGQAMTVGDDESVRVPRLHPGWA